MKWLADEIVARRTSEKVMKEIYAENLIAEELGGRVIKITGSF